MIERVLGGFEVTCDICGDDQTFPVDNWQALMEKMRYHEWRNKKTADGDWVHWCPRCVK